MSKSQSKNQNIKGRNPSDASTRMDTQNNLDSNQSAQSMSAGSDDTAVNQAQSGSNSYDTESTSRGFGEPEELESNTNSMSSRSASESTEEGGLLSQAASALNSESVKKNLNLVKTKAQDLLSSGRDQLSSRYSTLSDDMKLRGMMMDDKVKANPYVWALGAAGVGFILARAMSGKGKEDFGVMKSAVGKIDISALAGMIGLNLGEKASESASRESSSKSSKSKAKAGYNEKQARKIG